MYTNRDRAYSALLETIKIAIQKCKDEQGSVDYETCIKNYLAKDILDEWFWDKGSQAVILIVDVYGTYREAIIQIDGHRFNLQKVYNEVMKRKG